MYKPYYNNDDNNNNNNNNDNDNNTKTTIRTMMMIMIIIIIIIILILIIIIIIIIIAFKGAIRDCLQSPTRTLEWPERNRVQITCNTCTVYHVQHVLLSATWYEGTAQLLNLTALKSHLFEFYFIG